MIRASEHPIEPLHHRHDRSAFRSGAPELDRYVRELVSQDVRRHVAAAFVAVEADVVVGYYTLSASTVELNDLPEDAAHRLPRYPRIPATLLGRLAVDERWQGRGLGEHLLFDALFRAMRSEVASYAVVVEARDDRAVRFYEHYSFRPLQGSSRRAFLPMASIAKGALPRAE